MSKSTQNKVLDQSADSDDNTCTVCHDPFEVYAIGHCDHPVCYRCSTRMRVLMEQNECPICRSLMPQVAFVYDNKPFKNIVLRDCIPNRKYKIFFEDEDVEDRFKTLLEFRCMMKTCRNRYPDKTFNQLQMHMRREHQLFACDLCISHLKIFPFERKFYSRKDLATHRRVGDADDLSYKGHPLCEFCDTRFNDKDELWKHLRKDHYYCHFCDQHCSNTYYDQYPDLLKHFADSHHLCQEGECANPETRFTHAFVSEIDLKAHKAKAHNANLSRAQVREACHIEVDFHLAPRRQPHSRGGHGGAGITSQDYEDTRTGSGRRNNNRQNKRRDRENDDLHRAIEASKAEARPPVEERLPDPVADFPMLSGAPAPQPTAPVARRREEDFPSLSSTGNRGNPVPKQSNKAYASVMNKQQQQARPTSAPVKKESKPVSLGAVPNVHKDRWNTHGRLEKTEEDYPSLGGSIGPVNPTPNVNVVSWTNKQAVNGISNGDIQTTQSKKTLPNRTFNAVGHDFPTLGGVTRSENLNKNLFKESAKAQNKNKKKTTPRSQKFDDSFELPESYSSGVAEAEVEIHSSKDLSSEVSNEVEQMTLNAGPSDFPSWPVRSSKPETLAGGLIVDKKNKKKKKKNGDTSGKNPSEKSSSLNNIAVGLLTSESSSTTAKQNGAKSSSTVGKPKKTDWFDNPPDEYLENVEEVPERKQKSSEKPKADDCLSKSMAASAQVSKPPPGFIKTEPKVSPLPVQESQAPYKPRPAPPGFMPKSAAPPRIDPNASYIKPPQFKDRNQNLIKAIEKALETVEDGFINFRALSMTYRQDSLDACDYYFNCQDLIGKSDFDIIFPELLALLPDIGKQHDLFQLHKTIGHFKPLSQPTAVSQCPACGQVVMTKDVPHHRVQHGELENSDNFPSLMGNNRKSNNLGVASSGETDGRKGAWIRAK